MAAGTESVLWLLTPNRRDSGVYSVSVTNSAGGLVSSNATVKIMVPESLQPPIKTVNGYQVPFSDFDGGQMITSDLTNFNFTVQVSTNLAATNWLGFTNNLSVSNSLIIFNDTTATNNPKRFYRVMEQ